MPSKCFHDVTKLSLFAVTFFFLATRPFFITARKKYCAKYSFKKIKLVKEELLQWRNIVFIRKNQSRDFEEYSHFLFLFFST